MQLADFQALTDRLVRAPANKVTTADRDQAVSLAITRYSADRPHGTTEDVLATGSNLLALPLHWEADSALTGIEYPPGEWPPAMWSAGDFGLLKTPAGDKIGLRSALNAGEVVRVHFSVAHTVDAISSTIPPAHLEAVCSWAAAILCDQIAGTYASNSAPTIQADSADTSNPAREWRGRATGFRARYAAQLGVQGITGSSTDKPVTSAAGTVVEFDLADSRRAGWLNRYRT